MYKRAFSLILCLILLVTSLPMMSWGAERAPLAQEQTSLRGVGGVTATETEIHELFTSRSQDVHPRLLMQQEDFAELRQQIETDPYSKILYARIYEYALAQLDAPLCIYELPDGQRLLEISREASKRIIWCSIVYKVSGDRRFAHRAIEEMVNVCAFPDWHPDHYLDVAQMTYGVGLGYDWLYHELTASQRSVIAKTIYQYALLTCEGKGFWNTSSNWNVWCHGGLTVGALAIYESYPDVCRSYLSRAVSSIQISLREYAPLGSFPEGPGYYGVASEFTALFMDAMLSVLGTEFGLCGLQGMRESAGFYPAINGFVTTFNYGDGSSTPGNRASLHWYAKQFNLPYLSVYQRKFQTTPSDRSDLGLALLWYDPELVEGVTLEDGQNDYLLYSDSNESVASFRSFSGDPRQIYAAIKSGYNNTSHSDMDIGTFVMEAMGERWFEEMSQENYIVPGYWDLSDNGSRWTYYRKRAEGQNVYVLNPDKTGGQDHDAKAQIDAYESTYDGGLATVNMLDAYDSYGMTSGKRGLVLFDGRSRVLLRDEISCKSPTELYWFAHTKAEVSLSSDGKVATLTMNGKTLEASIGSPSNAVFTVMDAVPLSTSPNPAGNNPNSGVRKLVIHLTNVSKVDITVAFTPVYEASDSGKPVPTASLETMASVLKAYAQGTALKANGNGVYEIRTADELCLLSEMVQNGETFQGKTLRLMADIDLKNRNFVPIGGNGNSSAFRGTFDGNGHVIRNLLMFRPDISNVGLFGRAVSATIKDLGIENGTVFCGGASGALIGVAKNCTVSGCFSRSDVVGSGSHVGGIIGQLEGSGTVKNCYNTGDVKNSAAVAGGIVGYIASSTSAVLENCYHVGNLSDSAGSCGLVGFYHTTNSTYLCKSVTVRNCYSTQPLKGSTVVDSSAIEQYSDSAVISEGRMVSMAVSLGEAYIYDCQWENEGYPVFRWQMETALSHDLRIDSVEELRLLAYMVNSGAEDFDGKTVYLTCDLDLNSREWVSIGGYDPLDTKGQIFRGTFDGLGHTVGNLRISDGLNYMGFFGSVDGTIRNLGIRGGSVRGQGKVAGLAGYAHGTIENCFNKASVYGTEAVGGLVGMASKVVITNSFNQGHISSPATAGGLVGYFSSGSSGAGITNSYHAGAITASSAGSICCSINAKVTNLIFTNCYGPDSYPLVQSVVAHQEVHCSALSVADMKASAPLLGNGYMSDTVRTQNGGYPLLRVFAYGLTQEPALTVDEQGAYCITNEQDLRALAYLVNVKGQTFAGKTVKLCADMDLRSKEWVPIGGEVVGESRSRFSGIFDGDGHVIYNLTISSGSDYTGLFGLIYGGTVRNLGIESGMILGGSAVGSIVGRGSENALVENCYSKICVSGKNHVGGIVGLLSRKTVAVKNCYTMGSVVGTAGIGAIVGTINPGTTEALIENCYYVGTMDNFLLGKAGNSETTGITLKNCYGTGTAPLVAEPFQITIADSNRKTEAELRGLSAVMGSAFGEDYLVQNDLFPVLSWENRDCATALTLKNGVYEIGTAEELRLLSYLVRKGNTFSKKKICLTNNIDLEGKSFMAIGGSTDGTSYYFRGHFDGDGHVIRNINCVEMSVGRVGLFGMNNGATIENVGVESGVIIGYSYAAGLAGYMNGTTVRSCYNKATVYGNSKSAGIAGALAGKGSVTDCYNVGLVLAEGTDKNTGGIFGNAADSTKYTLENCYNLDTINGIGGNVNAAVTDSGMNNCYSSGSANLVRKIHHFAIENSSMVAPHTLRGYASVLGEGYVADIANINRGYPVLAWEMGALEDVLFFDFTNSEADRQRYNSGAYGWRNFDQASQWFYTDKKTESMVVDPASGEMILTSLPTIEDGLWPDAYFDTAIDGTNKTFPLNYNPENAEFFQIRFRLQNYRIGNTVAEGESAQSTVSPYLRLSGYERDMVSISATDSYTYLKEHLNTDDSLTVTMPISEAFRETEVIGRIRIYLGGVESMDGEQGVFAVDYIYIGPETTLPAPVCKVEFANQDGRILQSTYVPRGEDAVYYGSNPKKTRDETNHYTFAGWDKSLHNMEEDTVFTATFTATAHNYSYTKVDNKNHKASCSCGYSKTVSHTWDSGRVTTAAACAKTGVKTYTCTACKAAKTETVPALGHDYKYADNGNGTHTGTCARCKDVFTEGHKFTGETCFCGGKVLTLDESIKIYHTLDLASDISITFAVPQTALASYDSYYLEVVLPEYEGNTQTGTSTVQIQPVVNGKYYYFTLTGITAVRMNDMVDATLHMTKGTAQYVSAVDTYSVATYAYGMLNSSKDAKMLTLCADLLRYGAEAQSFKGYRTDSLVDANLTEAQRAYLSDTEALTFTATDSYLNDLASPVLSWVGKTLDLGSKVGMKFVFNAKNYSDNIENLSMKVTYKGSNGETKTVTLTGAEVYNAKNSYYSFTFYGLLASELRTVVEVAVYEGETQLTQTLRYSAESYASKNTTGALGNLCKALFAYSDSAKSYFTK